MEILSLDRWCVLDKLTAHLTPIQWQKHHQDLNYRCGLGAGDVTYTETGYSLSIEDERVIESVKTLLQNEKIKYDTTTKPKIVFGKFKLNPEEFESTRGFYMVNFEVVPTETSYLLTWNNGDEMALLLLLQKLADCGSMDLDFLYSIICLRLKWEQ